MFILNFHGLGPPPPGIPASEQKVWVNQDHFEAVLDLAKNEGDVAFTFDDANESDYTIAFPALQARDIKAQFFVVAGRVGRVGYLSPSQIKALVAAGMEIGNHGMLHRPWPGLANTELKEELVTAREHLEKVTGNRITKAACPYGRYSRWVLHELRCAGYQEVYTSDGGHARPGRFILPRNSVQRSSDLQALRTTISRKPSGLREIPHALRLLLKRWR